MECTHPCVARMYDRSTGDEICTECGRVLDVIAFGMAFDTHDTFRDPPPPQDDLPERLDKKARRIRDHVRMVAHSLHVNHRVVEVAEHLVSEVCARGMAIRDGTMRHVAASAVYYACKLEDVDRAEIEIAANCEIALKHVVVSNKRFRRALATTALGPRICAPANPIRLIPRFLEVLCADPAPIISKAQKHRIRTRCEDIGACAIRAGSLEGKSPECCCITFIFKALLDAGFASTVLPAICGRCGLTPNTILNALGILDTLDMLEPLDTRDTTV